MKKRIYLDDIRTPNDENWIVVRNYEQFVKVVTDIGLENIEIISLDHDLGDTAIEEYFNNVKPNYEINYSNILEKTGMDCAKWLVDYYLNKYDTLEGRVGKKSSGIIFPLVYTHSANPIGSANIMGYINNFLMNEGQSQSCVRVNIPHSV
jgi:hypothetical protein